MTASCTITLEPSLQLIVRVPLLLLMTVQVVPGAPVGTVIDVPSGHEIVDVPLWLSVSVHDLPFVPLLPSWPAGPVGPVSPAQPASATATNAASRAALVRNELACPVPVASDMVGPPPRRVRLPFA